MSHSISSDSTCEPNLTPLLDLVLQILMFFMVTVNFATEQTHEDVNLPTSQTALPLSTKGDKDPIFVNLVVIKDNSTNLNEHSILITGREPMKQAEARKWVFTQFEDLKRLGEVTNPIIIRAHREADYAQVFQLLQACSDAGFRRLKVRAIVNN